ncbi:MAG: penicillin acylase family protein, partial [Candidatus Aminicenantes bacterium]|nr:penicillin acylase family protein [Candidatus Aminicenantes bacterium]
KKSYEELKNWNCKNRAELIAPTIFEYFWQELCERIWNDDMNTDSGSLKRPNSEVTIDLILNQPECPYFDDKTTADKETLDDLAYQAFQSTNRKLAEEFGSIGQAWVWGKTRGTDIRHVAQIPGLGRINLETDGNSYIINAISKYSGPSWRMVVTLGPEVRAWGIYPGGQSGNPGSRFYDNAVDDWVKGKAYELLYLKSLDEENPDIAGKTKLRGVK